MFVPKYRRINCLIVLMMFVLNKCVNYSEGEQGYYKRYFNYLLCADKFFTHFVLLLNISFAFLSEIALTLQRAITKTINNR